MQNQLDNLTKVVETLINVQWVQKSTVDSPVDPAPATITPDKVKQLINFVK